MTVEHYWSEVYSANLMTAITAASTASHFGLSTSQLFGPQFGTIMGLYKASPQAGFSDRRR